MRNTVAILSLLLLVSFANAQERVEIVPDLDGVTVPVNIAPLHFRVSDSPRKCVAEFSAAGKTVSVKDGEDIPAAIKTVSVKARRDGLIAIKPRVWRKLTAAAAGSSVEVKVSARVDGKRSEICSFAFNVSEDMIDPVVAYRLIEPGYELWNKMGLYQRDLESFKQRAIVSNDKTDGSCMNCHSFCNRDPERFLFHMRAKLGGTYVCSDGKVEKLNTKTDQTISALVYPSWHPSGRYVAFSVNDTKQSFHTNDRNRVEVFDRASDVVVYDVEKHEIVSSPLLKSDKAFETFPTFSPDGKTLYFCSAQSREMPSEYEKVVYSLCSIEFDPETCTFGDKVKTVYKGRSASFPRVSPDGRFLMMTLASYGNFSIWHKDADLVLVDLNDGSVKPLDTINSDDVDSYHSWSSDGRWVVFSSRRGDGLYTRLYIAHIDADGVASKPFILPQDDPAYYDSFMKSYNIPEFATGPVPSVQGRVSRCARKDPGIDLVYREVPTKGRVSGAGGAGAAGAGAAGSGAAGSGGGSGAAGPSPDAHSGASVAHAGAAGGGAGAAGSGAAGGAGGGGAAGAGGGAGAAGSSPDAHSGASVAHAGAAGGPAGTGAAGSGAGAAGSNTGSAATPDASKGSLAGTESVSATGSDNPSAASSTASDSKRTSKSANRSSSKRSSKSAVRSDSNSASKSDVRSRSKSTSESANRSGSRKNLVK